MAAEASDGSLPEVLPRDTNERESGFSFFTSKLSIFGGSNVSNSNWIRSEGTEKWFVEELKVKFKVVADIRPAEIDMEEALYSTARYGAPLNEDVWRRYGLRLAEGKTLPYVILYELPAGLRYKYGVSAGNHRLKGNKEENNNEPITAYVVFAPDQLILDTIIHLDNRRNGWQQNDDEACQHAKFFMDKHGTPLVKAADMWKIKESKLRKWIREDESRDLLEGLGVKDLGKLTQTSVLSLMTLKRNQNVLKAAAAAATQREGMSTEEVKKLTTDVKSRPDEASQLIAVKTYTTSRLAARQRQAQGGNTKKSITKDRLWRALKNALYQVEHGHRKQQAVTDLCQIGVSTRAEVKDFHNLYMDLKGYLDPLFVKATQKKRTPSKSVQNGRKNSK
jgi:hypothetical protein